MKNTFKKPLLYIFVAFPLFFEFILKLTLGLCSFSSILAPAFMSASMIIPFLLLKRHEKLIKSLYLVILYIPVFINICHIIFFNSEISNCSFMTIFETNFQEVLEFFKHFLSLNFLLFFLFFWTIGGILFSKSELSYEIKANKKWLLITFIGLYGIFCFGDHRYKFPFEKLFFTYMEYKKDFNKNIKILKNRGDFLFCNIKSEIPEDTKQTFIIVIGESVNKEHMSIYGSNIKTTPKFDKIKQNLNIFKNVKSSYCHTQKALTGVLCFDEKFENGDIITFFKQAGFKTFWFSNQYTAGNCDSLISMIGSLADSKEFINKSHYRTKLSSNYDEKLVDHFKEAMLDKSQKKVIFLHLFGSHLPYSKRYPKKYEVFKPAKNNKSSREVSEYDNSILYTDHILDQVISIIKSQNEVSYVLYFSDHGEDITDDPKSPHTHLESLSTPPMFDIPFIIWVSEKYKKLNEKFILNWNFDKNYETKNLIHSIINLSRLSSIEYNKKYSIFSKE